MAFCVNCGAEVSGTFCTKCGSRVSAGGAPAAAPRPGPAPEVPATPAPAAAPRKTSPIVWILIIVAGLFVLGGIAVVGGGLFLVHKVKEAGIDPELMRNKPGLALAKLLAATNPDVEVISVDDAKGTIKLRQKSTGKTTTIDFDQAKKGKFTFTEDGKDSVTVEAHGDEQGGSVEMKSGNESVTFGANQATMPAWIPAYPGSTPKNNFSSSGKQGSAAAFTFETKDSPKDVAAFYERELKAKGFRITTTSTSDSGGSTSGLVSAEDAVNNRNVLVTVGSSSSGTTVNVEFQQK